MRNTQTMGASSRALALGFLGTWLGCSDALNTVSVCNHDNTKERPFCSSPLAVSCGADGRLQLKEDTVISLTVPGELVEGPPVQVSAVRADGMHVKFAQSRVSAPDTVQIIPQIGELGSTPGPIRFTVVRGSFSGESPAAPEATCRLYQQPTPDGGRSSLKVRMNIPYNGMVLQTAGAVAVQIGPVSLGAIPTVRSVLVTEDLPTLPNRWLEQFTLQANNSLDANKPPTEALWGPLRDQYAMDAGAQTGYSQNGLIIWNSTLSTIAPPNKRADDWLNGFPAPPLGAQLVVAADRDWFLLAGTNEVAAYRFSGTAMTPLNALQLAGRRVAMRAARSAGSDEGRAFDAVVASDQNVVSFLRLSPTNQMLLEVAGPTSLSDSATTVLRTALGHSTLPDALALGDLDGDGLQDLIIWDASSQQIRWAPQVGAAAAAQFNPLQQTGLTVLSLRSLAVGDVDADSRLDIGVVAGGVATVFLQKP